MKWFTYILALFILSSCEKLVQIDLPEGANNIVVESQITTREKPFEVRITNSQAYYNQDSVQGIEDALVIIFDDLGSRDTLIHEANGLYKTNGNRKCVPGVTYTLNVFYNNAWYSASELCRFQEPIDTLAAYYLPENNGFILEGWYAFIIADESEESGDYYEWKIFRNDTQANDFLILDEDRFREQSYFNLNLDPKDPLGSITQGRLPRPFPVDLNDGDTLLVEQYAISKGYYDFLLELQNQQNRAGTPFDPPPANPKSNISNGAFGYFSVANLETAEAVIGE